MILALSFHGRSTSSGLALVLVTWLAAGLAAPGDTLAANCTGDVERASKAFNTARSSIQAGKFDQAKGQLDAVLKILPCYPDAHLELGHMALQERRFEDALHLYQTALEDYAAGADLMRQTQSKRYMESRKELSDLRNQLARMRAGDSEAFTGASSTSVQTSEIEQRIRVLDSMQPPSDSGAVEPPGEVYFHIGNALLRLQRGDEALKNFEISREKSPKFGLTYVNLAVIYWRRGRLDDAKTALAKAEELKAPISPAFKADLERDIAAKSGPGAK